MAKSTRSTRTPVRIDGSSMKSSPKRGAGGKAALPKTGESKSLHRALPGKKT